MSAATAAQILFVSTLQPSAEPTSVDVRAAITTTLRLRGDDGCTQVWAEEFGQHPELAVARMRWANEMATKLTDAYALAA
jgi:hypothetical protein